MKWLCKLLDHDFRTGIGGYAGPIYCARCGTPLSAGRDRLTIKAKTKTKLESVK